MGEIHELFVLAFLWFGLQGRLLSKAGTLMKDHVFKQMISINVVIARSVY